MADRIERYSLPTDFGRKYRDQIARSANVTALLNARCIRVNCSGGDRVESILVADRAGRQHTVPAQFFVLAMGGIEAPRLLMNSDTQGPGLGNRSDHLGRYYACHFENFLGRLVAARGTVAFDFEKTIDGIYCRRKLQFTAPAQREHRLLNTAFRLHFSRLLRRLPRKRGALGHFPAKSSLIPEYRAILQHGGDRPCCHRPRRTCAMSCSACPNSEASPTSGCSCATWPSASCRTRWSGTRTAAIRWNSTREQTPLASSRVTLTNDVDHDGLRRVHVDWRLNPDDVQAAARAFALLRRVLNEESSCRLEFDEQDLPQSIARSIPLGGHHIGTTRMAQNPRDGVVDRNCAVFELPNLYIASSSAFCTSSHANPTLTIVALALRLAGHLKATVGAGATVSSSPPAQH